MRLGPKALGAIGQPKVGSLGLGLSPGKGGGAPTYLSVAPDFAVGTAKMVAGYAGACVQDGTGVDIGFSGLGKIDLPSASDLVVQTWCDQSGNGRHATQATAANRPRLRSDNAWRGVQGLTFDGFIASSGGVQVDKKLSIPAGYTLDRRANTTFVVAAPRADFNTLALVELGTDTVTRAVLYHNPTSTGASVHFGSSSTPTSVTANRAVRMNPSINGFRLGATKSTIYVDEAAVDAAVATAGSTSGGLIGASVAANFGARAEIFAVVSYARALSDAEVAAVQADLKAIYQINVAQTSLVVYEGDSGIEGTGDQYLMNAARLVHLGLSKDTRAYNMAVHGTSAQTEYGRRVAKWGLINTAGVTKKIAYIRIGSNDLNSGTSAATLYASYWLPYVQYIQGLGYSVIVEPVLPRGDAGWEAGGTKDNARLAFNQAIRDGAAANGYTVSDVVTLPVFDSVADTSDTTYWYTDKIHTNNGGYAALAAFVKPRVEAALAA